MAESRTLEIPVELYERIERLAAVREAPVSYVVKEALTLVVGQMEISTDEATGELPEPDIPVQSPYFARESAAIRKEEAAYRAMHSELFEKHAGQYVAIFNGELVDFDADESALYSRIDQRFPDDVVLMKKVEESPEKIYHFRSPRFVREG